MGTLLARVVLERAWKKAQDDGDTGPVRWLAPEGLMWLSDAQRDTVLLLPSSNTKLCAEVPEPGATQTLAGLGIEDGIQVLDVPYNVGADLETPGRAITLKDRKHFDEFRPNWRSETAAQAVHFMLDPSAPKTFCLYPAIVGSGGVAVRYSATPKEIVHLNQAIELDDIYATALQNYVLGCFYAKDTSFTAAPTKSAYYLGQHRELLGLKASTNLQNAAEAVAASNAKGAR